MPTVYEIVRRLFPSGTNPNDGLLINEGTKENPKVIIPAWPPDLFALAATLVELAGWYTNPRYSGWDHAQSLFASGYLKSADNHRCVSVVANEWLDSILRGTMKPPIEVINHWDILNANFNMQVYTPLPSKLPDWHDSAFLLMVLADEVCAGVGFAQQESPLAQTIFLEYERRIIRNPDDLPQTEINLPHSLCWMVPPDEVCVQPKVMTPQVGYTLRSFTHHLSILPSIGEVRTSWRFGRPQSDSGDIQYLNLLLVPFPYQIRNDCFTAGDPCVGNQRHEHRYSDGNHHYFFDLAPNWLKDLDAGNPATLAEEEFARFLIGLIQQAESDSHTAVHGVILPEFALEYGLAERVARILAERTSLELFVTGFCRTSPDDDGDSNINGIYTVLFNDKKVIGPYIQHKHHRWKLDSQQVKSYELDSRLNPSHDYYWWERMTLKPRECNFLVFRPGACLAALDCEDLGRMEPVQRAIRSVGANLVLCLLLDGAQIVQRWPHRYAMVLADDPGSSVLTLTSLGMMKRYRSQTSPYSIGLWKERDGKTQELHLTQGSQGLLLTLWPVDEQNFTADGRSDKWATVKISLSGTREVRLKNPPAWAQT